MLRLTSLKLTALTLVALAAATGCTAQNSQAQRVAVCRRRLAQSPSRIVTSWTDTVLYQPNQVPTRGFGGRILFYNGEKPEPVKVDGTLTVYLFDETNRDPNNLKPDRKYVFTKEQLPSHYSKSKLGHSYSVWLPWDDVGGPQKEVSIIARFTPDKGGVVIGEQNKQMLPGKTQFVSKNPGGDASPASQPAALNPQAPPQQNSAVQPAAYVTPLPPVDPRFQNGFQKPQAQSPCVETTTINLPPRSCLRNSLIMNDPQLSNAATEAVRPNFADRASMAPEKSGPSPNYSPPPPAADQRPDLKTQPLNPLPPTTGQIQPACYQTTSTNVGITASNPTSRPWNQVALPLSPPNRFALGPPQVPTAPASQPTRDPGQWHNPLQDHSLPLIRRLNRRRR